MAHKLSAMTHNAVNVVKVNDRESFMKTHFGQALHAWYVISHNISF
jgi:hypothetical protein